ncbi:MAG: hypothetical protein WCH85_07725 [Methanomicrobiales archaeon]
MPNSDKSKEKQMFVTNNEKKERILKALFEADELTRHELASNTGFEKKSGPYAAVSPQVDELERENLIEICTTEECEKKRLQRETEKNKGDQNKRDKYTVFSKPGPKSEVLKIKRDISAVHTIFNRYPALQDLLWEKEWVRDLIVKNQLDTRLISSEGIEELKEMLTLSPHFFRLCVKYNDLKGLTKEWEFYLDPIPSGLSPKELAKRVKELPLFPIANPDINSYRNLFSFCYFADEIDGIEKGPGYKIVQKYAHERACKRLESRKKEILSALEKVVIPIMKMFFDNINDESFDILDSKIPGGAKTLRSLIEEYTGDTNRMKRERSKPDWEDKYNGLYDDQNTITLEILKTLKEIGIIKNY